MGCLVALCGGLIGMLVGIAAAVVLLSGAKADAFTWIAASVVFGFGGAVLGVPAALIWRAARKRSRALPRP